MKIANVYGSLLQMHGATKYVMAFASELRRQGHDSILVCTRFQIPKPYWMCAEILEASPAAAGDGGPPSRLKRAAGRFLDARVLARRVPRGADAVVLHSEHTLPVLPFVRRRCPEAAVFYYCYQPPREVYDLWKVVKGDFGPLVRAALQVAIPVYRVVDRKLARSADRVLVFSPEYREYASDIYGPLPYVLVPAGIDFRAFDRQDGPAVEKRRSIRGEFDHMLLMSAALTRKKNLGAFVRLLGALKERGLAVRGTVIGEGPLEAELRALARELGVADRLVLTGYVSQEDLPEYYHAADVLYFLEPNGAWTLSIIEAGAAGIPVVVAPGGSMPTLVKAGESGLVLSEAWTDSELLERTLTLLGDPQLRARMGEMNRRHSSAFSLEASARAFTRAAEEVVGAP